MKKVLVTGGLGFIGNNVIAKLLKDGGYDIRVLDIDTPDKAIAYNIKDVEFYQGDIRDTQALRTAVSGVDSVIHLAAHTRVVDSVENPEENFQVNAYGTFSLLNAMRDLNVPFLVNASTGGAILGEAPSPVNENMPAHPLSPYGASKLAAEGYCSAFSGAYGMKTVSLRFSNIYGPYSGFKGSVIPLFFRQIKNNDTLTVYGDGNQTRDFLYAEDLAEAIVNVLVKKPAGVLQLGTGVPTSLNTLLSSIKTVVCEDSYMRVKNEPFRPGEVMHNYCNIEKARHEFGYDPQTSLQEGLAKTWDWFNAFFENSSGNKKAVKS